MAGHMDDRAQYTETPASCDRTVDFIVPASLPTDDKEFFEMMFTKYVTSISMHQQCELKRTLTLLDNNFCPIVTT